MAIDRLVWRDEELGAVTAAGAEDFAPRYDILDRDGRAVARGARLNLVNEVRVEGTRHNAENMNALVQKCDAQGSFFYRPFAGVAMHSFPHAGQASSWVELPPVPVDVGENPICVVHDGKCHVTLGCMAEYNGLTYTVAVLNLGAMTWDVRHSDRRKPLNLGGIEDFGVFDGRLCVVGKDWDNVTAATAWMDALDLDNLEWEHGVTCRWAENVHTIGPIGLEDGASAIVAGRDGVGTMGAVVDRITMTSAAPLPVGLFPSVNNAQPPVPSGVVDFAGQCFVTMPIRVMLGSANFMLWVNNPAHPDLASGHLVPVGADDEYAVFVAMQDGASNLFRMDVGRGITMHDMGRRLNREAVVRGGSRYFCMLSARADVFVPSADWAVFDATTGQVVALPSAPEVFDGYGLAATESMVFAARGNKAFLGNFGVVTQGVAVGYVFKGLSVSATQDVFLVNDRRTVRVSAGKEWFLVDDDYLVCVAGDFGVFGQIVNR